MSGPITLLDDLRLIVEWAEREFEADCECSRCRTWNVRALRLREHAARLREEMAEASRWPLSNADTLRLLERVNGGPLASPSPQPTPERCGTCWGSGRVQDKELCDHAARLAQEAGRDISIRPENFTKSCPTCGGTGRTGGER